MPDRPDAYLEALVRRLDSPYGYERSVKIIDARIYNERMLLSLHRDSLGGAPELRLGEMLGQLDFPTARTPDVLALLHRSDHVHFGYERYSTGFLYKCYLEDSTAFTGAGAGSHGGDSLVYTAFKWSPGNTRDPRTSYYIGYPSASLPEIREIIRAVYQYPAVPVVLAVVMGILDDPRLQDDDNRPMVMTVTEADNPRLSFDLNLYDAEMQVRDMEDALLQVAGYFELDLQAWREFYRHIAGYRLGHLAGGRDASGREFFTLYFGVEERLPDRLQGNP